MARNLRSATVGKPGLPKNGGVDGVRTIGRIVVNLDIENETALPEKEERYANGRVSFRERHSSGAIGKRTA